MSSHSRREFLTDVGREMLVGSLGSATASDLGLSRAVASEGTACVVDAGCDGNRVRALAASAVLTQVNAARMTA